MRGNLLSLASINIDPTFIAVCPLERTLVSLSSFPPNSIQHHHQITNKATLLPTVRSCLQETLSSFRIHYINFLKNIQSAPQTF